jgi:hypothetical protein
MPASRGRVPTGQTLQSTTVARCLFALADLAAARADGGSGITRPLLMRLLGLGHLSGGPAPVASGATRALIRQEGLFGDARNWRGHLEAIGTPVASDADDPDEAGPRHINRLAPHAHPLAELIGTLDTSLGTIAEATTWTDLGLALWTALETSTCGTWWRVRPTMPRPPCVRTLLLDGFPAIDALGAHASPGRGEASR